MITLFLRGLHDKLFFQWKRMGIVTIQDLFREGTFSSSEQLKQHYALVSAHFFPLFVSERLQQILNFEVLNLNPTLERIVSVHPGMSGSVSNYCKKRLIITHDWEEETGFNILIYTVLDTAKIFVTYSSM